VSTLLQRSTSLFCMSSIANLISSRSFLMLLRVAMIMFDRRTCHNRVGGGWTTENQRRTSGGRREERRRDPRWRGGDGEGRADKWDVEGGRGEVVRSLTSCQVDQTTRPYSHRGSIEGRGQGRGRRVAGLVRHNYRSQDRGENRFRGVEINCRRGVSSFNGRVWDGRFPSPGLIPGCSSLCLASESGHDES
jgi:hypothetical protein